MRRCLCAGAIFVAACSPTSEEDLTRGIAEPLVGPVASFGFDEGSGTTTFDKSGNQLSGTLSAASWVAGKYGSAVHVTGASSSWITVQDAAVLHLSAAMTLEAWVRPTTTLGTYAAIIMKQQTGEFDWTLYANAGSSHPAAAFTYDTSTSSEVGFTAGPLPAQNTWTHLAETYDGATLRLYVNGSQVGTIASTKAMHVGTGVLRFGGDSVWSGEQFTGDIDEVRIYGRALSAAEIQTDMTSAINGQDAGSDAGSDARDGAALQDAPSDAVSESARDVVQDATAEDAAAVKSGMDASGGDAAALDAKDSGSDASGSTTMGPLRVKPGARYLVDSAGAPFFLHGDSPWAILTALTNEDAEIYLEDRRQRGFNAILVVLIDHVNAPGVAGKTTVYGDAPFTTPGDFSTPNEAYFAHADAIIQKAASKGFHVFLTPAYLGFNGGVEGWYTTMQANGTTKLAAYGQWLGNRYRNQPNIVWLEGGDYNPPDKTLTRAVATGIKSADPNHLHTVHCNNGTSALDYWAGETWLDIDDVYAYPAFGQNVAAKTSTEYQRTDWKPVFLVESGYENENGSTPESIRRQAYETVLSGGFGSFFGNAPIWCFGTCAGPGTWRSNLASTGTLDMVRFAAFFRARRWDLLVPDLHGTFLTADMTSGSYHASASRASDGSWGAVYMPTSRSIVVDLSGFTHAVRAVWFNPATGASTTIAGSPFANSGTLGASPPSSGDWVLVLE